MSSPPSEGRIHIPNITFSVAEKSHKIVHQIVLQTRLGGFKRDISCQLSHGHEYKVVFDGPIDLSAQDELFASLQYHTRVREGRPIEITLKQDEITRDSQVDANGNTTYTKFYRNINTLITIEFSRGSTPTVVPHVNGHGPAVSGPAINGNSQGSFQGTLLPTTKEILRICPRFRLLIIGNTGVGKSSLVRDVFGVKDALVSDASRGMAQIDKEFIATENELFVVHDSLGLEAAEGNNLAKVKEFIHERREKEDLKDRLHAVWVCLPVPYAKGRLLETGMEEFLRDRKKILGDIPVVVVLTKLDLLDNHLMMTMRQEGVMFKTIEEAKPRLQPRRETFLEDYCTQPLKRAAGDNVPHVAVSTKKGYSLESTIPELVKKTISEIEQYIGKTYSAVPAQTSIERNAQLYVAGMAQRVSIEEKVDLTIAIGRRRYWSNINAGFTFSPDNVKEQLYVIHQDIIQVWNFDDPEEALQDDKLKEALLDTSDIGISDIGRRELGSIPVLGPLLKTFHSDVVTLPIRGVLSLASFCTQIFQAPQTASRRFMEYIADLTYVMRILFVLAPQGTITTGYVAFAFDTYKKSVYRNLVHLEIDTFFSGNGARGGREAVVEKIKEVIKRHNISDQDVLPLRSQISGLKNVSTGS